MSKDELIPYLLSLGAPRAPFLLRTSFLVGARAVNVQLEWLLCHAIATDSWLSCNVFQ